jgi:hypothetical protein
MFGYSATETGLWGEFDVLTAPSLSYIENFYLITNFMELSSSREDASRVPAQELHNFSWEQKVRYTLHKNPPQVPEPDQSSSYTAFHFVGLLTN